MLENVGRSWWVVVSCARREVWCGGLACEGGGPRRVEFVEGDGEDS